MSHYNQKCCGGNPALCIKLKPPCECGAGGGAHSIHKGVMDHIRMSWITENLFGIKQFSCSVKINTSLPVKCNYPTRTPCENFSVGCSHGKKSGL